MKKPRLRKTSKFIKVIALIMCLCVTLPTIIGSATTEESIKAAENRKQELQNEKEALDAELEKLKEDETKAVEYQQALDEKITVLKAQIDEARIKIDELDKSITELEAKIQKSQDELGNTMEMFKERIKALYKSGSTSEMGSLEILMSSTSLHDFSQKSEMLKSVSKHDEQLMGKIEEYLQETETERTECEAQKEEVAELKKGLESDGEELEQLQAENEIALENIKDSQAKTQQMQTENEAESASLQAEISNLIAQKAAEDEARRKAAEEAAAQQNQSGEGSSGGNPSTEITNPTYNGGFNPTWPIPGVTYISCHYGNGHYGLDIAGPYGTPIVAAESGEVIMANDFDSWGQSWGYYVLIYHNGTYTTRYAHLSTVAVYTGQTVSKGQVIGYEGSTGNSTGPHLHFEVYQNGSRVNPYSFL